MKSLFLTLLLCLPLTLFAQSIDLTKSSGSNWIIVVDQDTLTGTHRDRHTAYNRLIDEAVARGVYDIERTRAIRTPGSNWYVVVNGDTLPNTFIEQYTAIQAMVNAVGDYDLYDQNIRAYQSEEMRFSNTGSHFIRAIRNQELRLDRLDLFYLEDTIYEEVVDTIYVDENGYQLLFPERETQLLNNINWQHSVTEAEGQQITLEWKSNAPFVDLSWQCVAQDAESDSTWWGAVQSSPRITTTSSYTTQEFTFYTDCETKLQYYVWAQDLNWGVRYDDTIDLAFLNGGFEEPEEPIVDQWVLDPSEFNESDWIQYWHGSSILSSDGIRFAIQDTASGSNVWINQNVPNSTQMEVYMVATTTGASPHIRAVATPNGYAQDIYYAPSLNALQYAYWNNPSDTTAWAQNMYSYQLDVPVEGSGELIHMILRVEPDTVYVKAWFGDIEPTEWLYTTPIEEYLIGTEGGLGIGAHSVNTRYIEYLSVGINGKNAPRP